MSLLEVKELTKTSAVLVIMSNVDFVIEAERTYRFDRALMVLEKRIFFNLLTGVYVPTEGTIEF